MMMRMMHVLDGGAFIVVRLTRVTFKPDNPTQEWLEKAVLLGCAFIFMAFWGAVACLLVYLDALVYALAVVVTVFAAIMVGYIVARPFIGMYERYLERTKSVTLERWRNDPLTMARLEMIYRREQ